ncbi:hypothetical protein BH10PSE18_BH10PSE18_15060 [soil metagenome]
MALFPSLAHPARPVAVAHQSAAASPAGADWHALPLTEQDSEAAKLLLALACDPTVTPHGSRRHEVLMHAVAAVGVRLQHNHVQPQARAGSKPAVHASELLRACQGLMHIAETGVMSLGTMRMARTVIAKVTGATA